MTIKNKKDAEAFVDAWAKYLQALDPLRGPSVVHPLVHLPPKERAPSSLDSGQFLSFYFDSSNRLNALAQKHFEDRKADFSFPVDIEVGERFIPTLVGKETRMAARKHGFLVEEFEEA